MRTLLVTVLASLLLGLAPPGLAQDGVGVELRVVATTLEPGKSYLVGVTVTYPCGPSRAIRLEVAGPEWTETGIDPNFRTDADECLAPYRGEYRGASILVAVFDDAEEGATGNLTVVARDGDVMGSATASLAVRRTTPQIALAPDTATVVLAPGASVDLNVTTTYTHWTPGRVRWIADAPEGWKVTVPAARQTTQGQDQSLTTPIVVRAAEDAVLEGDLRLHAVLLDRSGARVAESPVATVALVAVFDPIVSIPLEGANDDTPIPPPPSAPRAPLWVVGGVIVAAIAGIYVLERREPDQGISPREGDVQEGARARDAEERP